MYMYMYMYICVCVCMVYYIHTYIHTYIHKYIKPYMHACICEHVYCGVVCVKSWACTYRYNSFKSDLSSLTLSKPGCLAHSANFLNLCARIFSSILDSLWVVYSLHTGSFSMRTTLTMLHCDNQGAHPHEVVRMCWQMASCISGLSTK